VHTHRTVDCDQPYDVDFANVFKALHSVVHSKAPLLRAVYTYYKERQMAYVLYDTKTLTRLDAQGEPTTDYVFDNQQLAERTLRELDRVGVEFATLVQFRRLTTQEDVNITNMESVRLGVRPQSLIWK
jgi:hypothetical protein